MKEKKPEKKNSIFFPIYLSQFRSTLSPLKPFFFPRTEYEEGRLKNMKIDLGFWKVKYE